MSAENLFKDAIESAPDAQLVFQNVTYHDLKKRIQDFKSHAEKFPGQPVLINIPMGVEQATVIAALLYFNIPALVLPNGMKAVEIERVKNDFPFAWLIEKDNVLSKLKDVPAVDFSWMLYTSGSTGQPKIVTISYENLKARTLGEIKLFNIKKHSRILNLLPFSHDLGLNQLLTTLASQSSMEILVNKLPLEFAKKISEGHHDGFTGMPQIWNNFIAVAEKTSLNINYKGFLTVSGGSMSEENLLKLRNLFPHARIYKTYGQTETFRTFAESRQDKIHEATCGHVIEGVTIKIVSPDGTDCRPGETGELIHTGAGTMNGYWLQKSSEGFVATGDYFKVLTPDEWQFMGRKDHMIKHASRRFFLGEVEAVIMKSGLVSDVCVVQARDDRVMTGNEKLVAFVVPVKYQEKESLGKMIRSYCAGELETFKVPDEYIVCEHFPLTSSHKTDRMELMRLHQIKKKDGTDVDPG